MNFIKRPFHHTNPTSSTTVPTNIREPVTLSTSSSTTTKPAASLTGSVRFNDLVAAQPKFNDREKYLTAKYPQQQMQLIRKRLKVEFWLDDQLRSLYDIKDDNPQEDHDHCPGDLIDSLLDIDSESQRRTFLLGKLRNVKKSRSITMEFIDELLHRVKML
ncbi:unnamed protein product [Rotaria magnacalcarata]|uniref:Uncharacterized protein n=2 Tax=Rotaria magnacalcarata TaxID=392030 RepID=A0A819WXV0_9BILA|nr:unnamed protein product [Rotaria magnacalcarata]CAF1647922.1 unnamed protein product [Rotaria magnacalcarata]CAF2045585.1 unnamed protein product [Rotaria magnacalcarata]CAF2057020.1 unnamed protein product [Rotaria magnacalcarata]CAF3931907.1 unnamed protein product [Rotaria magnacalcarata]